MHTNKDVKNKEEKLSKAKELVYELQTLVKFGALSCDSNIIDKDLQLDKLGEDYYLYFKTINEKISNLIYFLDS